MTAENRKGARHCGEIPPVWKEPGKSRECPAFPGPLGGHSRTEQKRKMKKAVVVAVILKEMKIITYYFTTTLQNY